MAGEIREQIATKMQSSLAREMEDSQKQTYDNEGRAVHRKETYMDGRDGSVRAE